MKLTAVHNNAIKNQNINNKSNKSPNFKGGAEALVNFWRFVDSSRGIQFTVEDMLGTNIPRTWKGATAGRKYTGKYNIPGLLQEAFREFLTGPTMTLSPVIILGIASKLSGKTADTHGKNIRNLSYIAKNTFSQKENVTKEMFEKEFLQSVVEDVLKQTTQKEANKEDIETLIESFTKYSKLRNDFNDAKTNKLPRVDKKNAKEAMKKAKTELEETFRNIIKAAKDSYKDTDFQIAKHTGATAESVKSTPFKNYIDYTLSYIEDYTKTNISKDGIIDLTEKTISKFNTNWLGKRGMVAASMILLTGFIMSFIPKIYTLVSGKVNPNASAIYNEAEKREGGK